MICSTTGPEKITPEWLTAVFRKEGLLDSGHVTRVRAFCSKTLPVSQVSRLAVKYSSNVPDGLPVKFFLKLSKPGREAAVKSDIGQNESRFYQLMRGEISGAPLVRCFVNEAMPESGVTCLVMEDLTDTHFQPASPNAPSEAQSISAVECLARFHAHWWNHPKLGREVGRVFDAQWLKIFLRELESSVARFVEFLGDDLSSERGQVYRKLLSSSSKIWEPLMIRRGSPSLTETPIGGTSSIRAIPPAKRHAFSIGSSGIWTSVPAIWHSSLPWADLPNAGPL